MKNGELTIILRRWATRLGISILIISALLSFDGFDGSVSGVNPAYSLLGYVIGAVFAVTVSALQFIFSTNIKELNRTLVFAGLFSYVYSIYTNKLGASHLLGMNETMAWITAFLCDVVAEPLIAWGMGEALVGDFIGNLTKTIFGTRDEPVEPKPTYRQSELRHQAAPERDNHFQQSDAFSRLPKAKPFNQNANPLLRK